MLRGHSSHYVLENLLHDFDELGSNWGMARSSGYGRQPLLVPQFSSLTFSRSTAAVESTIRDCAQALGGQEEFASLLSIQGYCAYQGLAAAYKCWIRRPHWSRRPQGPQFSPSRALRFRRKGGFLTSNLLPVGRNIGRAIVLATRRLMLL